MKRKLAAFVCSHVFDDTRPILLVAREDGDWMFLCGATHPADEKGQVVGINHLVERDPTLAEVRDLPDNWEAERVSINAEWRRKKSEPSGNSSGTETRMSAGGLEVGMDPHEAKLLADVEKYGWHKITVPEDDEGPGFTFTVGLFHSYRHPEVIVFGLPNRAMQGIVDVVAGLVKGGTRFADEDVSDEVLRGYRCWFRKVSPIYYPEYFGYAIWFYKSREFPALQCVWPDKRGRFPWQEDCEPSIVASQPALCEVERL